MIFVVGGKGFVGSAIVRYLESHKIKYKIIQRENKDAFFGKKCSILIYANGNPYRYKADEDPYFDFMASLESTAEYVHKIKYKKFVLISTVGVYGIYLNKTTATYETTKESDEIDEDELDNYGYHKLLAENYVKHFCKDYLIFRLPAIVGKGLKKNQAYDFIHKNKKVMVSKNSSINFINTDFAAKTIFKIIKLNIKDEIFNIASENNIKIKNLKKILGFDSEYSDDSEKNVLTYYINVEKIKRYVKLSRSEDAILEYYKSLTNKSRILTKKSEVI